MRKTLAGLTLLLATVAYAKTAPLPSVFYVYHDKNDMQNHFIPSGWMGDYGDLKIDDANKDNPEDGRTAIKWTYTAKGAQGANWAGVFWQHPANNWGDKPGGFDLSTYKRVTFWARGAKGGETIQEFKAGGITGEFGDTDSSTIGPVTLTPEWQKYTIDLADKNMAKIIGGFCWSTNADSNPNGMVIYLDEIRYEK